MVSPQGTLGWVYDVQGRVVQRTTSEGSTPYAYDGDGRLSVLTTPDGRTTTYTYDAAGRISRTEQQLDAGTGVMLVTDERYDADDRQVAIAHSKRVGALSTLIAGQALTRGTGGAVTRIDTFDAGASYNATTGVFAGSPMRAQTFGYDANARLAQENNYKGAQLAAWLANNASPATQAVSYVYDAVGNRTSKTSVSAAGTEIRSYVYDSNDRPVSETLTTVTGSTVVTSYSWDANGNLASKQTPSAYTGYVFDLANRLVEVRRGASAATATVAASYAYDADGQRISKTTPAGTTRYLIDPTTPFPQIALESTGSQRVAYVWGDSLRQQTRGGQGTLFGGSGSDAVPLAGHLGTPIAAADRTGSAVERLETDAYGDIAIPSVQLAHGFAGEYWDDTAGLLQLRARWYDPSNGRLLSPDPYQGTLRDPRTLNRYVYAGADPVDQTDPSGLMSMGELSAGMEINAINSSAAQAVLRQAFASFGCELGLALADQAVTYGIYVLFDGVGFYVGQSVDIDNRLKQHIKEAEKTGRNLWKQNAKILARIPVPGARCPVARPPSTRWSST
jgi:RHS repeat-associated protein